MPAAARYVYIVSMDVEPDKEDLFNEVYEEHIGFIRPVPGVHRITRAKTEPAKMKMGTSEVALPSVADEPNYTAIYEIDGPEVLESPAWLEAVEAGRWASQVRPYTKNRRHVLRRVI